MSSTSEASDEDAMGRENDGERLLENDGLINGEVDDDVSSVDSEGETEESKVGLPACRC